MCSSGTNACVHLGLTHDEHMMNTYQAVFGIFADSLCTAFIEDPLDLHWSPWRFSAINSWYAFWTVAAHEIQLILTARAAETMDFARFLKDFRMSEDILKLLEFPLFQQNRTIICNVSRKQIKYALICCYIVCSI